MRVLVPRNRGAPGGLVLPFPRTLNPSAGERREPQSHIGEREERERQKRERERDRKEREKREGEKSGGALVTVEGDFQTFIQGP